MKTLDYLLGNAVAYDHLRRADWLIGHGADPDGVHAYSGRRQREEALVHGHVAMAALLERHGAAVAPLEGRTAFKAACMRLDRAEAEAVAGREPACLEDAEIMITAARQGRVAVVGLLLALGMDKDIADGSGLRGIQSAVMGGSIDVVRLLVEAGADIDRPTKQYDGALGFANHFQRSDIVALLAPRSRDIPNLVNLGQRERLAALFAAEPGLVNAPFPHSGLISLFVLPPDDTAAVEMAEFLLAHGADRGVRDAKGRTPAERARERGLVDAAEVLEG
jgi:ankyrin repeat protein